MKILKVLVLVLVIVFGLARPNGASAATSPTLSALTGYSVLGGAEVTCTGATTTTGAVGVSPGTSITGFPSPCTAGGGTQSNNASAIAAQAEALATFSTLDQTCDQTFGAVDLTATFPSGVGPGVYCSTSSFTLTGNLNLTGSGVHIFKTVSTLITSSGSSITGGDACNVWWRVGSSATLGTTTAFKGNIFALNGVNALNSGATLDGRIVGLAAATVTLNANTISGPSCAAAAASTSASSLSAVGPPTRNCPVISYNTPFIVESRRVDEDSIFIRWAPESGINTFRVLYGFENGNWLYNTMVTGFSTTINGLPPNQPIWVQIAATDGCSIGNYGESMLVGGTSQGTLIPLLPNAGFAPSENNIPWYIPGGIFVGISVLFVLIGRKNKSSSRH